MSISAPESKQICGAESPKSIYLRTSQDLRGNSEATIYSPSGKSTAFTTTEASSHQGTERSGVDEEQKKTEGKLEKQHQGEAVIERVRSQDLTNNKNKAEMLDAGFKIASSGDFQPKIGITMSPEPGTRH